MSCDDDCYGGEVIELADRVDDLEEQVKALHQRLLDVETHARSLDVKTPTPPGQEPAHDPTP